MIDDMKTKNAIDIIYRSIIAVSQFLHVLYVQYS